MQYILNTLIIVLLIGFFYIIYVNYQSDSDELITPATILNGGIDEVRDGRTNPFERQFYEDDIAR